MPRDQEDFEDNVELDEDIELEDDDNLEEEVDDSEEIENDSEEMEEDPEEEDIEEEDLELEEDPEEVEQKNFNYKKAFEEERAKRKIAEEKNQQQQRQAPTDNNQQIDINQVSLSYQTVCLQEDLLQQTINAMQQSLNDGEYVDQEELIRLRLDIRDVRDAKLQLGNYIHNYQQNALMQLNNKINNIKQTFPKRVKDDMTASMLFFQMNVLSQLPENQGLSEKALMKKAYNDIENMSKAFVFGDKYNNQNRKAANSNNFKTRGYNNNSTRGSYIPQNKMSEAISSIKSDPIIYQQVKSRLKGRTMAQFLKDNPEYMNLNKRK